MQFDLNKKASIYAKNKIAEFWVVDLVNKQLIVHTAPKLNEYKQVVECQAGVIKPQAFPDIEIELPKLIIN